VIDPTERSPIVSVIMPAFDALPFVSEAIGSVLGQTFASLELLVADDGSRDGTLEAVRAYNDPRLHVLTQRNRGPSATRNLSLSHASGRSYVAFIDADDRWDPEKLARQVAYMEAHPTCAVVGCLMRYVSSDGRRLGLSGEVVDHHHQRSIARGEYFPFPLSSFLVRRQALEESGGFDESLRGSEDIDFLARLSETGSVACLPEVLGSYRIHPASAMARNRLSINQAARFVRRRLAARRAGKDLSWETFVASDRTSWRDWRQDWVEVCYRGAALWYGERHYGKALLYGVAAAFIDPRYTVRRLRRQRRSLEGRRGDPSVT
jgi:glycosyltransferase involved in cell wall biosynthesis